MCALSNEADNKKREKQKLLLKEIDQDQRVKALLNQKAELLQ